MSSIRLNIHRARGIRSVTSYGQQDPYVRVVLKPASEGGAEAEVRSKVAASGGTDPRWGELVRLKLPSSSATYTPTALLFEVWHDATFGDELIGAVEVGLWSVSAESTRYELDTGGSIEVAGAVPENLRERAKALARSFGACAEGRQGVAESNATAGVEAGGGTDGHEYANEYGSAPPST